MKIGFLFPGQGAQTVGMCKDYYDKYDEVKAVYDKASKILPEVPNILSVINIMSLVLGISIGSVVAVAPKKANPP